MCCKRRLPAGTGSSGDAAARLNALRGSIQSVHCGIQPSLVQLVTGVPDSRRSSQRTHAGVTRSIELEIRKTNLICWDQLAVLSGHAESDPLAHTVDQHLWPRMEHRTVEPIGSGMGIAEQPDFASRVSLPRLLDNSCHMRRLLHSHTLVVQRVRWVKHEHGVLSKLPGYVVVQHNRCVRSIRNRIVARVFVHCGSSCGHTGGKRWPHKLRRVQRS